MYHQTHWGSTFLFLLSHPAFLPLPFSPRSIVLFDTFVNILSHNLGEPAYEADVAQLEYKLVAGEHGLVIRVKGFNHKLPVSAAECFWVPSLSVQELGFLALEPGWVCKWAS